MAMKNPPHPGEMIGDALEELGVSISAAAKSLGVTRQQIHNVIAGRSVRWRCDLKRALAVRQIHGCACRSIMTSRKSAPEKNQSKWRDL
jgi:hypothetical protein